MPAFALIILCLFVSSCTTSVHFSKSREIPTSQQTHLRLNEINSYAAEDFLKRFSNQANEQWYKTSYGYLARFTSDNIATDVYYNMHGAFIKDIKYYETGNIPADVKEILAKKFPEYSIVTTAAITNQNTSMFQVKMRNEEVLKTVEISGNTMEVLYEIKNGVVAYR